MNHLTQRWAALTVMGKQVYLAEVDCSRVTSTRVVVAYAKTEGERWFGLPMGVLTWDRRSKRVELVQVAAFARRKGIATAMWEFAQTIEPGIKHSEERTPDGTAWARAVGGEVPKFKRNPGANAGPLMVWLDGFTSVSLLSPERAL